MADKPETETRTMRVGDEVVTYEAVIGRNVPRHVEPEDDDK